MIYSEISSDYQGFYAVDRNNLQYLHRHEQGLAYTRADEASKSEFWSNLISQSVLELIFYAILLAITALCGGQALMGQIPWYWGLLGAVMSAFTLVWRFNHFVESKRIAWQNIGIMRYRKGYAVRFPKAVYALGEMLELSFQQDIAAGQSLEHNSRMYMRLVCMEYSKYRVGTENRSDIATLWSSPTYIYHISKELPKLRVDMQVEIPEDGVISKKNRNRGTHHEVIWILQLREEVETYERDLAFAIQVVPAQQSAMAKQPAMVQQFVGAEKPVREPKPRLEQASAEQTLAPDRGKLSTTSSTELNNLLDNLDFLLGAWRESGGEPHAKGWVFTEEAENYVPKKVNIVLEIVGAVVLSLIITGCINIVVVPIIWGGVIFVDMAIGDNQSIAPYLMVIGIVLVGISCLTPFIIFLRMMLKVIVPDKFSRVFQPARVLISAKECSLGDSISLQFVQKCKSGKEPKSSWYVSAYLCCVEIAEYTSLGEKQRDKNLLWASEQRRNNFDAATAMLNLKATFDIPKDAPVSTEAVERFGKTKQQNWFIKLYRHDGRSLKIPIHVKKPEGAIKTGRSY